MNTNETKKPISFDMELTEEQMKQVAGGLSTSTMYQCPVCGTRLCAAADNGIPEPQVCILHYRPLERPLEPCPAPEPVKPTVNVCDDSVLPTLPILPTLPTLLSTSARVECTSPLYRIY